MDLEDVVELRVHGVSGTPAPELLDRPLVDLVAGDSTAGFYRAHLEAERNDDYPLGSSTPTTRGPLLEGYVWGGLTSGAPSRSFWLLLLPFTLSNVAPRLRPAPCTEARVKVIWYLSRLLALACTVVLVAAFVGMGVDLVGWQCSAHVGRCGQASPGWLFDPITRMGTGRRIMIGSLVPVLGLAVLWWLSGRTIAAYERVSPKIDADEERKNPVEQDLDSPWMWQNEVAVRRLRALHVQVGAAAALAMIGAATRGVWQWLDGLIGIVVGGYAVIALARESFGSRKDDVVWKEFRYPIWGALGVAGLGTAWWLQRCDDLPENPTRCSHGSCVPAGLPHYGETIVWLLIGQLVLVGALIVVLARQHLSKPVDKPVSMGAPGPKPALFGFATAVIALMSVFLGAVFTSGAYLFFAAWLTSGSLHPKLSTVSDLSRRFAVPEAILDGGLAYALAVGLLLVAALPLVVLVLRGIFRAKPKGWLMVENSFSNDYPHASSSAPRTKTVLRDLFMGRIVDVAGDFLGIVMLLGAVLTYVFGLFLLLEHGFHVNGPARWLVDPVTRADLTHGIHPAFFSRIGLQGKGAYLVVLTLVLLVALGAAAFRVQATRRSVGILWDLASFWPRLAHPLAAPCYAERTVPDLVNRIRWHTEENRGVVLAGHSQGTVISAATVLQLKSADDTLDKVSLVTVGCVLRRLYGRYFPAYFGPAALREVGEALDARWWNLWRYTDYLGGPVMSGPPPTVAPRWDPSHALPASSGPCTDLHLIDPPYDRLPGNPSEPPALRHSDFWKVEEFQIAASRLAELIPAPD